MLISRFAGLLLLAICVTALAGCSGERDQAADNAPAAVDAAATPAPTPEPTPTPSPTPEDDRSRTQRVAEHQRRLQELIRQKQIEQEQQKAAQPPGTETQYQ